MPIRICGVARCPNFVTSNKTRGYCEAHYRERERERSAHRRETTKGVYKKKLWIERRRQVLHRDPICTLCGERLSEEVDHIVPLSRGGAPSDAENLQGTCRQCHQEKTRRENRGG